jgi:hypothetical protein
MRAGLRLSVACLVLMLATSAAMAQWWPWQWQWPSRLMRGNDTGGIISWSCENEAAAQDMAAAFCARHRKFHRITSVNRGYGNYIGFNCLWHDEIARFILPAVPTRTLAACVTHEIRPGPTLRVLN